MKFTDAFPNRKPVIGMVHLSALPGAPHCNSSMDDIYRRAAADLETLERGGADAAIVENFGDVPYCGEPELMTLTAMTALATRLRGQTGLRLGLNVQFNHTEAEWCMALAAGYEFIRVEAFSEHRAGVHGVSYAAAPALMRLKGRYPAPTMVFADINSKHTYPLVPQPMADAIHEARDAGADALIVTGGATGQNPTTAEVQAFKALSGETPVLLGSGVRPDNAASFFAIADGAIVGSSVKADGNVWNPVDPTRLRQFMEALGR